MAQIAGDGWRDEYSDAWADAYAVVQTVMSEGAEAAETAAVA